MAVGTAFKAVNMSAWQFLDTNDVAINEQGTIITETDGLEVKHYLGQFDAIPDGDVIQLIGGTLTGTDYFIGGVEQYRLTGLDADAVTVYDYLVQGGHTAGVGLISFLFSGADTLNGSRFADIINGFNGVDTLNGNAGNDKLNGGTGADHVNGGAGADTIVWGAGDTVNGAAGSDTLKLTVNLNLVNLGNTKITNIETIDMNGGGNDTLKLGTSDVLALSSSTNTIRIVGDTNDVVNIDASGTGSPTAQGDFMAYHFGKATLLIDADVNVHIV